MATSGLHDLEVFLWNARSIVNNLGVFQSFVYFKDIHVIALTEAWCHSNISDREILPTGCTIS